MNDRVSPPAPKPPAVSQAIKAQYLRPVLNDLIDMGMTLVRHIELPPATSQAAETAAAIERASLVYERASRAVRCSIMLAQTLAASSGRRVGPQEGRAARMFIIRAVENSIRLQLQEAADDVLQDELEDWLDDLDAGDEIDDGTISEIIAAICRDLGLATSPGAPTWKAQAWKRRTPKDIAALCARAARPWGTIGRG